MAGILEKLLSIQGETEQISIDTLSEAQNGPQELDNLQDGQEVNKTSRSGERGQIERNRGIVETPPPSANKNPDMMEAWREAYRIFSKYSPALRAAVLQDEDNEAVSHVFAEALPRVASLANMGGDAAILAAGIYEILDQIWKRERQRLETLTRPGGGAQGGGA